MARRTFPLAVSQAMQSKVALARLVGESAGSSHDCWPWAGYRNGAGYGVFGYSGRLAHRVVYEHLVESVPEGLELDHLCRNRACVNPWHLEPVTHAVNVKRGSKAQQTHCIHGHEFTPENTTVKANGCRSCRQCRSDRHKREARAS